MSSREFSQHFTKIINALIKSESQERSGYFKVLAQRKFFYPNIIDLLEMEENASNNELRILNLKILMELLTFDTKITNKLSEEQALTIFEKIAHFPIQLSSSLDYSLYYRSISLLVNLISFPKIESVFNEPNFFRNLHGPYVLSITLDRFESELISFAIQIIPPTVEPTNPVTCLSFGCLLNHLKSTMYYQNDLNVLGRFQDPSDLVVYLLQPLFNNGNEIGKESGILLLQSFLHYFSDDPKTALLVFHRFTNCLYEGLQSGSDRVKELISEVVNAIPATNDFVDFKMDSQLSSLSPVMAPSISDFSTTFSQNFISFVKKRKKSPLLIPTIQCLSKSSNTYLASALITSKLKLLDDLALDLLQPDDDLDRTLKICQSLQFYKEDDSFTARNIPFVTDSLMAIFADPKYQNSSEIMNSAVDSLELLIPFSRHAIPEILKYISNVYSFTYAVKLGSFVLECFNQSDQSILPNLEIRKEAIQKSIVAFIPNITDDSIIITSGQNISSLSESDQEIYHNIEIFLRFLHLLNTYPSQSSQQFIMPPMPITIPNLLSLFFTNDNDLSNMKATALIMSRDRLAYIPLCAPFAERLGEETSALEKRLVDSINTNIFSEKTFAQYWSSRIISNPRLGIKGLEQIIDQKTKGFLGLRTKQMNLKLVAGILRTIANVLLLCHLDPDLMKRLLALTSIFPRERDSLVEIHKEVIYFVQQLSNRRDAIPPESLTEEIISIPYFAEHIPHLITKLRPNDDRVKKAATSWCEHISFNSMEREKSEFIAKAIFDFNPKPSTLSSIIEIIIGFMQKNSDCLPFIEFAIASAKTAHSKSIDFKNPIVNTILTISPQCLSVHDETRYKTIYLMSILFNLPQNVQLSSNISSFNENDQRTENISISSLSNESYSPIFIKKVYRSLIKEIIIKIGKDLSFELFDKITFPLQSWSAILTSEILSQHCTDFSQMKSKSAHLTELCQISASTNPSYFKLVEEALLSFAKTNIDAFITFVISNGPTELISETISHLLCYSIRDTFINSFFKYISVQLPKTLQSTIRSIKDQSANPFKILNIVADSPSVNEQNQGIIIAILVIIVSTTLSINSSQNSGFITKFVSPLFAKYLRLQKQEKIECQSIEKLNQSIQEGSILRGFCNMDSAQFNNFYEAISSSIKLKNTSHIFVGSGMFLINIAKKFSTFKDSMSEKFSKQLWQLFSTIFHSADKSMRRKLAWCISQPFYSSNLSGLIKQNQFYTDLVKALNSKDTDDTYLWETLSITCEFTMKVQPQMFEANKENLIKGLQKNMAKINLIDINPPSAFDCLVFLAEKNIHFIGDGISCVNLMRWATYGNPDSQIKALKALMISKRIQSTKELISHLCSNLEKTEIREICTNLFRDSEMLKVSSPSFKRIFKIIFLFSENLLPEASDYINFFDNVYNFCLEIVGSNNPMKEKAISLLKIIY